MRNESEPLRFLARDHLVRVLSRSDVEEGLDTRLTDGEWEEVKEEYNYRSFDQKLRFGFYEMSGFIYQIRFERTKV